MHGDQSDFDSLNLYRGTRDESEMEDSSRMRKKVESKSPVRRAKTLKYDLRDR